VSFDQWLVALHVLAAFSYVAGLTLFWTLVVAVRRVDTPDGTLRLSPVAKVGNAAVGIGGIGTIVLGVWLAFKLDSYAIWDGWIIVALVLWAISAALGRQTGVAYLAGPKKADELQAAGQTGPSSELLALNRTSRGLLFQTLTSLAVLLVLIDMIWKPGA